MASQRWYNANLVRLRKAVLCANCEIISEPCNSHCAGCGSEALLHLSELLGETVEWAEPRAFAIATRDLTCTTHADSLSAAA